MKPGDAYFMKCVIQFISSNTIYNVPHYKKKSVKINHLLHCGKCTASRIREPFIAF